MLENLRNFFFKLKPYIHAQKDLGMGMNHILKLKPENSGYGYPIFILHFPHMGVNAVKISLSHLFEIDRYRLSSNE